MKALLRGYIKEKKCGCNCGIGWEYSGTYRMDIKKKNEFE